MFLFSHIGYTLAAVLVLNNSLHINRAISNEIDEKANSSEIPHLKGPSAKFWTLVKRARGLDLRFIIIGSLLPDIIDKPIGLYFFRDTFGTGRLYCHTILFATLLFLAGFLINICLKKNFMLMLVFGTFSHLILDSMWQKPRVLFWPLFGFSIEKSIPIPFGTYLRDLIIKVFETPWLGIPELIAAIIIIWFVWLLWHQKKLHSFILTGRV